MRMFAYHLCETPLVERTAGAFERSQCVRLGFPNETTRTTVPAAVSADHDRSGEDRATGVDRTTSSCGTPQEERSSPQRQRRFRRAVLVVGRILGETTHG
jgi:hypothetical protein